MSKYFTDDELKCPCCGEQKMDIDFMEMLDELRIWYAKPMIVSSAYRCPKHNLAVSTTGEKGPHTTGRAIDIKVAGEDAYTLVKYAMRMGLTGIGIAQKGERRFIHLDDLEMPWHPRPRVWSY